MTCTQNTPERAGDEAELVMFRRHTGAKLHIQRINQGLTTYCGLEILWWWQPGDSSDGADVCRRCLKAEAGALEGATQ